MEKRNGKVKKSAPKTKYLGKQTRNATDKLDVIPWKGSRNVVQLQCSEFTSHCPVTGQPDFGKLQITYVPDKYLVETKSMKLFLWQYRNKKAFNEQIVDEIAAQFYLQVKPRHVAVEGKFFTRGGISVVAKSQFGGTFGK